MILLAWPLSGLLSAWPLFALLASQDPSSLCWLAQHYFQEAVECARCLVGDQHPLYAATLLCLAELLVRLRQFESAITSYEAALSVFQLVYGEQHASTVDCVRDLAVARQLAQGKAASL